MKAVLLREFGDFDGMALDEAPDPIPGEDEVVVDVSHASVTYMDWLMAAGRYQHRPGLPYSPGTDAAGVVSAVGAKVTRFRPRDRVVCGNWAGGFAEKMVAKEWRTFALPEGADPAAATTVLHNYGTGDYALIVLANLRPGETIFVSGASGGVGLATVDLARKLGARVIAGVGSAGKEHLLSRYGADAVVNYREEDLRARIKDLTGGRGVDVCFDNVGGEVFLTMARCMNWRGRLMPIGFASGDIPSLPMNLPLVKNYSVIGVFSGAWMEREREAATEANETILRWLAEGEIHPHIDRIMPLAEAAEALRLIAERKVQGRVVLAVRGE
jgi:NADPH2:quinone reductase